MSDQNVLLSGDQIKSLLSSDSSDCILNSVYEIENVLLMLKAISEKIDFFKELKKFRTKSIDEKIADLEVKSIKLRTVVLDTMKKLDPDHTTLNFPSIGSVTRKKATTKWEVGDEDSLKGFLEESGCKNEVVKVKETLDSRKLKKILDDFYNARVDVPGVTRIVGDEGISIKYDLNQKESEVAANKGSILQQTEDTLNELDGITSDDL